MINIIALLHKDVYLFDKDVGDLILGERFFFLFYSLGENKKPSWKHTVIFSFSLFSAILLLKQKCFKNIKWDE